MSYRTLTDIPGTVYDAEKTDVFYAKDYNDLASDVAGLGTPPVKATGAEINTGTDDAKFATPKAIADSNIAMLSDIPATPTFIAPRVSSASSASSLTPAVNTYDNFNLPLWLPL